MKLVLPRLFVALALATFLLAGALTQGCNRESPEAAKTPQGNTATTTTDATAQNQKSQRYPGK